MAAVNPRVRRRGRRAMSEINVVPYIDVMLVLLVIFMVTAPFVPTGNIELPSVGKSSARPDAFIEVVVPAEGDLVVRPTRIPGKSEAKIARTALAETLRGMVEGNMATPIVISGDRESRYDAILGVMNDAREVLGPNAKVGLMVKQRPQESGAAGNAR